MVWAQDSEEVLERLLDFVNKTRDYREGFSASTGVNDFIYHSFRTDIDTCLLTRTTDGTMAIEWTTYPLEEKIKTEGIGFLWIAAMDINNSGNVFDLYFNDIKRFTISSSTSYNWYLESVDGGSLVFFTKEKDQHGDAHGYMALWAPRSWLVPGKPQKIKIVGEAGRSNTWIIVFKATDAAAYLQQSIKYAKWLKLEVQKDDRKYKVSSYSPGYFAGETLTYSLDDFIGTYETEPYGNMAKGYFELPGNILGKPFIIKDSTGEIMAIKSFGMEESSSKLLREAIIQTDQKLIGETRITIHAQRIYSPQTV
jgi:hypothetical protein